MYNMFLPFRVVFIIAKLILYSCGVNFHVMFCRIKALYNLVVIVGYLVIVADSVGVVKFLVSRYLMA
jgi:hypothetical protein